MYLGPYQTSVMELFRENIFAKSFIIDFGVLNKSLILRR